MQSLSWYLHRLHRMSAGELLHRAARAGRQLALRVLPGRNERAPISWPGQWPSPWIVPVDTVDAGACRKAADEVMAGRHRIFDLDSVELGQPPAWNRDPLTGTLAPLRRGSSLDYRDPETVGNIKYLWEPNRHLHLVTLAQAHALTGDPRYARGVRAQLESWIAQCPYPLGPNWSSSLELGIRLINWSLAWQLLGGADSPVFAGDDGLRFRQAWLESVYRHVRHIMENLSLHSSANNHLIGEAAGALVAACTWPCWPRMPQWRNEARAILEEEALRQNAPDGGNREQAVSYQQFVLDFLLVSGLAARSVGVDFSESYWNRIEAMIVFLASIMDVGGHVPMIGDADDGYVVRLAHGAAVCPYRSLIATGAVLFDRPDLARKAGDFDDKSSWLLSGLGGAGRFRQIRSRADSDFKPTRAFPESGYFVLGEGFETAREIRMIVDAGPLGYLKLAAHGHADALAVVLSVAGEEILIDPGTFCYHTDPEWRRYFRGTSAHNTVVVDGADQSVQRGNFMWSNHAQSRGVEFDLTGRPQWFRSSHDGYVRLRDPVTHRREIRYDEAAKQFLITDELACSGSHQVSRFWHFSERLCVTLQGSAGMVRTGSVRILVEPLEEPTTCDLLTGSREPVGGWISRGFGRMSPGWTLRWRSDITGTTVLRTRITCRAD
jgi:hypothetical protein